MNFNVAVLATDGVYRIKNGYDASIDVAPIGAQGRRTPANNQERHDRTLLLLAGVRLSCVGRYAARNVDAVTRLSP